MKLIVSIVQDADADAVLESMAKKGYRSTKIGSTGGFLFRGNTTILTGVQDDQVQDVLGIFGACCKTRREFVSPPAATLAEAVWTEPFEVEIGGANIFILNVERFERI